MAGRPPKPTIMKLLAGNPGKRNLNMSEPDAGDMGPCPEFLKGVAAETYEMLRETMGGCGVLKASDEKLAALIAMEWQTLLEVNEKLALTGPVIVFKDRDGNPRMRLSPYLAARNSASDRLRAMLGECGMTPSARQKITVDPKRDEDEERFFVRSG